MIRNLDGVEFAPPLHEPTLHCVVKREGNLIMAGIDCENPDHTETHGRWKANETGWRKIDG